MDDPAILCPVRHHLHPATVRVEQEQAALELLPRDAVRAQVGTGIIEREGDGYAALCPELDIASQGDTVEDARRNLVEALELFFECADPSEIEDRLRNEVFITRLEVKVG